MRAEGGRAFGVRQPLGPVVVVVWVDISAACATTGLSVDPAHVSACGLLFAWLARRPIRASSAACSLDCSRKVVSACVAPQIRPTRRCARRRGSENGTQRSRSVVGGVCISAGI